LKTSLELKQQEINSSNEALTVLKEALELKQLELTNSTEVNSKISKNVEGLLFREKMMIPYTKDTNSRLDNLVKSVRSITLRINELHRKNGMTRNFKKHELSCPCCGECNMDDILLTRLQAFRDILGIPLTLTSAFRCESHNQSVGGGAKSQHLHGTAVDIRINDKDASVRHKMIQLAYALGFTGIGLGKNHFHLDTRSGTGKSWSY
jgi:uncharacterized protein YcbK (DUF882 family)